MSALFSILYSTSTIGISSSSTDLNESRHLTRNEREVAFSPMMIVSNGVTKLTDKNFKNLNQPVVKAVRPFYFDDHDNFKTEIFDLINYKKYDLIQEHLYFLFADGILTTLSELHNFYIYHLDFNPDWVCINYSNKESGIFLHHHSFAGAIYSVNPIVKVTHLCHSDYLSPERCLAMHIDGPKTANGIKVDSWAVGVSLFQIVTGKNLFLEMRDIVDKFEDFQIAKEQVYSYVKKRIDEIPELQNPSEKSIFSLINFLLAIDPNKRLSPKEALMHPWMQKMRAVSTDKWGDYFVKAYGVIEVTDVKIWGIDSIKESAGKGLLSEQETKYSVECSDKPEKSELDNNPAAKNTSQKKNECEFANFRDLSIEKIFKSTMSREGNAEKSARKLFPEEVFLKWRPPVVEKQENLKSVRGDFVLTLYSFTDYLQKALVVCHGDYPLKTDLVLQVMNHRTLHDRFKNIIWIASPNYLDLQGIMVKLAKDLNLFNEGDTDGLIIKKLHDYILLRYLIDQQPFLFVFDNPFTSFEEFKYVASTCFPPAGAQIVVITDLDVASGNNNLLQEGTSNKKDLRFISTLMKNWNAKEFYVDSSL